MTVKPEQYKNNLGNVLDWFQDRACARLGSWLGTKLPFDSKWIIEPISDSTLYPIYYLVSLYFNEGKIKLEEMSEDFFDYIFLGRGKPKKEIWTEIRADVLYWYPLDVNLGGKEHQTVHFPVFIMNHIGILPKEMWPKGIFVNYWVLGKGNKISKSKGGAQPIPEAIKEFGVDAMRLYYAHIAGPEVDVIWDEEIVHSYKKNLERIYNLVENSFNLKGKKKEELDKKLLISLNKELKIINESLENFDLRYAANSAFFLLSASLREYLKDGGENKEVILDFLEKWIKVMAPFCPHITEELWEKLGHKDLISVSEWPKVDDSKLKIQNKEIDLNDKYVNYIKDLLEKFEKGTPVKKVYVYVVPFELTKLNKSKIGKEIGKELEIFSVKDEKKHDPENKSKKAIPGIPGIYFE
jgi:leucyl-tRNA synthetase